LSAIRLPDSANEAPAEPLHGRSLFPCSQSQKRFWFESQLHPDNPGLNVAVRWRLDGEVCDAHLEEAWRIIIERHQTLRTTFTTIEGEPYQVVQPSIPFQIPIVDLTALDEEDTWAEAERVASLEARRTFDISVAPLIRVTHVRVRSNVSMILVTAHHAVCDGWSVGVLAREMGEICAALQAGRPPALPGLSVTYADYAAWEREWLSASTALARAEFAERLRDFEQFEILPDKARPPVQTANGDIASVLLDRELTETLKELARANNCTLFMTAYAALLVLLYRYSGATDIALGTQIAGRDEVEFEHLVGTFINTVALRTDVSGDPTFQELLARACDTVTDALELHYVPLEELVEIVNPKRDLSRNALFSINFVFQRSFIKNEAYGAFRLVDLPSRSAGPICDLNFFMVERPEGWRVSCEFNTDLYRRWTVERMLDRFVGLLRAVTLEAARPISALPLMSDEERGRVVGLGAGKPTSYERTSTVHEVFARQAARTPDAIAVADDALTLSYAELERRSNQLARYLRAAGIDKEAAVGVALERSADVPVVLLAVLKAGAVYVPLETSYPPERLAFIVQDAGVRAIVTQRSMRERLPSGSAMIVDLEEEASRIAAERNDPLDASVRAEGLAYIMYTSGSTGRPKGVAVAHRAILRLVRFTDYVDLGPDDTILQYAPLAFDAATFEIWGALLNGGRLAIPRPGLPTLAELDRALETFGVTTLWLTASLFREFVEGRPRAFGRLRRLLAGGDVVSPLHAKRFIEAFPNCRLINGYGPTENTTFSCCYVVPSIDAIGESVPLGRPIANSSAYVLDSRLQPVPFGVIGELCVGGDGLARGYVNLPELTAERFVPNPFSGDPDDRLYRTGDRARQREDGVIEFIGRFDDQVKIRGFRIEPHEIESALSLHPDIADTVVAVGFEPSGDKAIWAYVVPRGAAEKFDVNGIRTWLSQKLPAFMLPSAVVALPALPLSANGKVDRNALPAPVERRPAEFTAYRGATEARLAEIIGELLGLDRLERDVDIFALGFHSLLALRLAARVQQEFNAELRLRALFEQPTVAGIAAQIDDASLHEAAAPGPIVTLNAAGTRTPWIFFHGDLFADGLYSRKLAAALGSDQPVHTVATHGTAGLPLLPTIEEMARDYAARVRAVQPEGPYRLGGFCASGLAAYELARVLRSQGEVIERLVIINSSPMPKRRIPLFDALIRRFGLDTRLEPGVRDRICYNLARLHAAAVKGPAATARVASKMLTWSTSRSQLMTVKEPQPFEKRRGLRETENSFAHVVAAFTYHPKPYDGDVTLIWSEDQSMLFDDPTMGWGEVAGHVAVVPMSGGHIAALSERVEDLARAARVALSGSATV
jgi:amino acid adenylation domain-containing protein